MKTALWDDLHVSRGKAEQLEARLRRQAIEDEVNQAWEERTLRRAASGRASCCIKAKIGHSHCMFVLAWAELDAFLGVTSEWYMVV